MNVFGHLYAILPRKREQMAELSQKLIQEGFTSNERLLKSIKVDGLSGVTETTDLSEVDEIKLNRKSDDWKSNCYISIKRRNIWISAENVDDLEDILETVKQYGYKFTQNQDVLVVTSPLWIGVILLVLFLLVITI